MGIVFYFLSSPGHAPPTRDWSAKISPIQKNKDHQNKTVGATVRREKPATTVEQ